jgi:hypothetical protein
MARSNRRNLRGRGSHLNPPNRLEKTHTEPDGDFLDTAEEEGTSAPTEYLPDHSRTLVTENNSPDIPFRFSINPYRGCSHGCSYCYARPSHEYLGLNAGLDFERKIFVKEDAPGLFRDFLARGDWVAEVIALSGVTDPYQPAERHYRLTRGCLEVAAEASQPMSIITKNALVVRDLDLLAPMAADRLVHVNISVTTLDTALARSMEPRTSTPAALASEQGAGRGRRSRACAGRAGDSRSQRQRDTGHPGGSEGSRGQGGGTSDATPAADRGSGFPRMAGARTARPSASRRESHPLGA